MKVIDEEEFFRLMHPKPSFLVSAEYGGKKNTCAVSWATPVSEEPPILLICLTRNSYTSSLILKSGEFTLSVPLKNMLKVLWGCGTVSGRRTDKSKKFSFEYEKGVKVSAPHVKGCAGFIECRVRETVHGGECYVFLGDVLHAEVDEKYFSRGWKKETPLLLHVWGKNFVLPGDRITVK